MKVRRVARGGSLLAPLLALSAGGVALGEAAHGTPAELVGTWRGTSVCTDRAAAPACHDETVVYELTAGARAGTVHWVADKFVEGQRERMGELELTFDAGEGCWKAEFSSPRVRSVWRLRVEGSRLSGTARLVPGGQTIRALDLVRAPAERPGP